LITLAPTKPTHRASGKKRRTPPRTFTFGDIPALLRAADAQLALPAHELSERVDGRGECVARFVLRLDQCKDPANQRRHTDKAAAWMLAKSKAEIYEWMSRQHARRAEPLSGRPMVRCIRFSAKSPDRLTQWSKVPVDRLLPPRTRTWKGERKVVPGLNFIQDDSPKFVHVVQFWEPAPVGKGFAVIECWSGAT